MSKIKQILSKYGPYYFNTVACLGSFATLYFLFVYIIASKLFIQGIELIFQSFATGGYTLALGLSFFFLICVLLLGFSIALAYTSIRNFLHPKIGRLFLLFYFIQVFSFSTPFFKWVAHFYLTFFQGIIKITFSTPFKLNFSQSFSIGFYADMDLKMAVGADEWFIAIDLAALVIFFLAKYVSHINSNPTAEK